MLLPGESHLHGFAEYAFFRLRLPTNLSLGVFWMYTEKREKKNPLNRFFVVSVFRENKEMAKVKIFEFLDNIPKSALCSGR